MCCTLTRLCVCVCKSEWVDVLCPVYIMYCGGGCIYTDRYKISHMQYASQLTRDSPFHASVSSGVLVQWVGAACNSGLELTGTLGAFVHLRMPVAITGPFLCPPYYSEFLCWWNGGQVPHRPSVGHRPVSDRLGQRGAGGKQSAGVCIFRTGGGPYV